MASLNKLKTMKDAETQHWLVKVDRVGVDVLVRALLGADEVVLDRVLRNMSETARTKLKDKVEKARAQGIGAAEIEYNTKKLEALF